MFALNAPATASANATFSITPWVVISAGSWPLIPDAIVPSSFIATVDAASKTITVTGQVTRTNVNPAAACPAPALATRPTAATVSVAASASSGTYTILIPAAEFTTQAPQPYGPTDPMGPVPPPAATRSIVIL
jgi:hypothetical protein